MRWIAGSRWTGKTVGARSFLGFSLLGVRNGFFIFTLLKSNFGSISLRCVVLCSAVAFFILACGQGAALRSAQEAGETVRESSVSRQSQGSTGAVKEISLSELSAMNKVAKPLPEGAVTSGSSATRSSGTAATTSGTIQGTSVPTPRTTVSGMKTVASDPDLGVTKDITGLDRVVLQGGSGKVLTQSMINQRCRRYILKGSFDLGGKTITMPYGSVLDLENGELRNGTLVMDQTRVTPIYGISKETRISKVKVTGEYYETLVDLWGVHEDPVFPWDTSAPKKVYVVDLKKFGITPGYQRKGADGHYTDRQYDLMYQNGVGFTEAIQWAYQSGYDGIRFPKNDYCFAPRSTGKKNTYYCAEVLVQDLDKFDIDLGKGSYYTMIDSKQRSKYSNGPGPVYEQLSFMFWVACCVNVSIHDGKLVGDRLLRDYEDKNEVKQEHSKGIMLGSYCYSTRIYRIDGSSFMGDVITSHQTGNYFNGYETDRSIPSYYPVLNAVPAYYAEDASGKIRKQNDNPLKCTVTEYMDLGRLYSAANSHPVIRQLKERRIYTINNNRGYTRIPDTYLNMDILTFDSSISKDNPLRIIHSSYLDYFELLPGETGIRLQFYYDEGVKGEGHKHSVAISDVVSSDLVIEDCFIHDNHKGGISGGRNNTVIRRCRFEKKKTVRNEKGTKIPVFSVGGTNYHIDYEDSYAKGLTISSCTFSRDDKAVGKMLIGNLYFTFSGNVSDTCPNIYNNILSVIADNKFKGLSFSVYHLQWKLDGKEEYRTDFGCKYITRTSICRGNTVNVGRTNSRINSLHIEG